MKLFFKVIIAMATLIGLSVTTVTADETFQEKYAACKKMTSNADRLKCFDALESALKAEKKDSIKKTLSKKSPAPIPLKEQVSEFGSADLKERGKNNNLKKMTSILLEIRKNNIGKNVFHLENGQVWRQIAQGKTRPVSPRKGNGGEITIKRKTFGSHFLYYKGRSFKVERIK